MLSPAAMSQGAGYSRFISIAARTDTVLYGTLPYYCYFTLRFQNIMMLSGLTLDISASSHEPFSCVSSFRHEIYCSAGRQDMRNALYERFTSHDICLLLYIFA
jgi:hypothetical protein